MKRYFSFVFVVMILIIATNVYDYFTGHFLLKSGITAVRNLGVEDNCDKPYPVLINRNDNLKEQFLDIEVGQKEAAQNKIEDLPLTSLAYFSKLTSYHELVPTNGDISKVSKQLISPFGTLFLYDLTDRYGMKARLYSSTQKIKNKVLIVLHGRDTNHEYLWGIDGAEDYMKQMAGIYAQELTSSDLTVLSIPVFNGCCEDEEYFGMNSLGYDISRVLDLINALTSVNDQTIIGIAGISYGGRLSELVGAFSQDIKLVLTVGGSVRSLVGPSTFENSNIYVSNKKIYESIYPRTFIVSIADKDGNASDKMDNLKLIEDLYIDKKEQLHINTFCGFHTSDPFNESKILNEYF